MQVTVSTKVQGNTEFSSEGVSIGLTPQDLGLEEPKSADEAKKAFDILTAFGDYMISTHMYKMGWVSKEVAVHKRKEVVAKGILVENS